MKVAVYYRNDDIRIEERDLPTIGDEELLVKMMASGICGTDVMEWYRVRKAPRVLGHEMAGVVVKTGSGVERFREGDRVFVSHHVPCGNCRYCLTDRETACETLHTGNYDPGGFSEYIRVPEENVISGTFTLPKGVTYEDATMIEPLACVIAGQRQISMDRGASVLVIGSGISGLSHIMLAKMKGARIIATDIDGYRLNKALEFGADHVINAREYSVERFRRVNEGRLAEVVIVCAGAEKAVEDALASVDRKGTILFFAVPAGDIRIPSVEFWRNEITVRFSYGAAPRDLQESLRMIADGRVDVGRMITHRIALSDIQYGFSLVSEARESLKVVVVPDREL
jgi:L-iditol 2-dehydrogenase